MTNDIHIELRIRLKYLSIYNKETGELLHYSNTFLIFNNIIDMREYIEVIVKEVSEKNNCQVFNTIMHDEYSIRFIWGTSGNKIYIPKIQHKEEQRLFGDSGYIPRISEDKG